MAKTKRSRKATYTKVTSIAQLQKIAKDRVGEFWLCLTGCHSTKLIEYDSGDKRFHIEHLIDGAEESLTKQELAKDGRISDSIKAGTFFFLSYLTNL